MFGVISSKDNPMKIVYTAVVALVALIGMNIVAAQETAMQPKDGLVSQDNADDCIEKIVNDSSGSNSRQGKDSTFKFIAMRCNVPR
jgi:hypothetical protein